MRDTNPGSTFDMGHGCDCSPSLSAEKCGNCCANHFCGTQEEWTINQVHWDAIRNFEQDAENAAYDYLDSVGY